RILESRTGFPNACAQAMLFQFLMTAPDCASARPGAARPTASVRVTAVTLAIFAITTVMLIRDMTSLLVIRSTPAGVPVLRPGSSGLMLPPSTVHKRPQLTHRTQLRIG